MMAVSQVPCRVKAEVWIIHYDVQKQISLGGKGVNLDIYKENPQG